MLFTFFTALFKVDMVNNTLVPNIYRLFSYQVFAELLYYISQLLLSHIT
jgi:hypothetical protein